MGPLILSHNTAKFGVHRSCESGDIPVFICHVTVISKSHVNFMGEVLSSLVIILLSLGSIGLMELEIMAFVISVQIPIPFPIPIPMLRFQSPRVSVFYKRN